MASSLANTRCLKNLCDGTLQCGEFASMRNKKLHELSGRYPKAQPPPPHSNHFRDHGCLTTSEGCRDHCWKAREHFLFCDQFWARSLQKVVAQELESGCRPPTSGRGCPESDQASMKGGPELEAPTG